MFKVMIQYTLNGEDEGSAIEARDRKTFEPMRFSDAAEAMAEVDRQRAWRPAEGTRRIRAWVESETR